MTAPFKQHRDKRLDLSGDVSTVDALDELRSRRRAYSGNEIEDALDLSVNLGNLGEVVKVKDGYARNFLIPSGRARRATDTAIKEFEARRAELEKQAADKLSAAQGQGEKLSGANVKLTQKAGVDGRLFGSVTNHDIAEELGKMGFDVHKSQVRMPNGPIKTVSESTVQVALHTDVVVDVNVTVYGETA